MSFSESRDGVSLALFWGPDLLRLPLYSLNFATAVCELLRRDWSDRWRDGVARRGSCRHWLEGACGLSWPRDTGRDTRL